MSQMSNRIILPDGRTLGCAEGQISTLVNHMDEILSALAGRS
jgi:hypothetical protein